MYAEINSFFSRRFWHFYYALKDMQAIRGSVLEAGCGLGAISTSIKKMLPNLQITAVDKDEVYLSYFKKHNPKKIKIVKANLAKLPFKDNSFDAVIMMEVLEHIKNPKQILKEIKRVLKPKAILHFSMPLERSLATWDGWFFKLFKINLKAKTAGHIRQYTLKEIEKLFSHYGLKIHSRYYSQHNIDQLFSLIYYFYRYIFRLEKPILLLKQQKYTLLLTLLLRLGSFLGNSESFVLRKIPGRIVHLSCQKMD